MNTRDRLVFLTIFLLPFSGVAIPSDILTFPEIVLLTTVLYFAVQRTFRLSRMELYVVCALAVSLSWQAVIYVWAADSTRVISRFGYLLLISLIFTYVDGLREIRIVLWSSFLSAMSVSVLTVLSAVFHVPLNPEMYLPGRTLGGFQFPFPRALGVPGIDYGILGMYLLTGTPYYAHQAIVNRNYALTSGVVLVVIAAIITQSRGTWLAFVAVIALYGTVVFLKYVRANMQIPRRRTPTIAFSGVVVFILLLAVSVAVPLFIQVQPRSITSRIMQYEAAIYAISANPLTGMGIENFRGYRGILQEPHNAFLFEGVAAGVFPMIAYLGVFSYALFLPIRHLLSEGNEFHKSVSLGLLAAVVAIFIESAVQPSFGKAAWVAIGLSISLTTINMRGDSIQAKLSTESRENKSSDSTSDAVSQATK